MTNQPKLAPEAPTSGAPVQPATAPIDPKPEATPPPQPSPAVNPKQS